MVRQFPDNSTAAPEGIRRNPWGIVAPFSSFVPRDPQACGRYVAKYVCKDLAFESATAGRFDHVAC